MDPRLQQGSPRSGHISTKHRDSDKVTKPESPYLQEHLQARRGNAKRSRRSDAGPRSHALDDDLFAAEAQAHDTPSSNTTSRRGTPGSGKNGPIHDEDLHKGLGVRELEKHMDKISKLNFDLKMELFHCRERMARLQDQCGVLAERAEKSDELEKKVEQLAQDKKAMLDVNDEMIKELEKRDEAVKEAVNIICDLEEKVEVLEQHQYTQASASAQSQPPFDSPERYLKPMPANRLLSPTSDGANGMQTPDSLTTSQKRVPSFMSDKKPSTNALRSVYLEPSSRLHAVKSYTSLLSQRDDMPDPDALDSPHMSVLSESSFPSIYSPKRPGNAEDEPLQSIQLGLAAKSQQAPSYDRYQNDNSRINEWVTGRIPSEAVPLRQRPQANSLSRKSSLGMQYQSLDDPVVYAALQEPFDENNTPTNLGPNKHQSRIVPNVGYRQARSCGSSLGAPVYGEGIFPPTPESVSTRLLGSRSSLADSRILAESFKPRPVIASRHETAPVDNWHRYNQTISTSDDDTEGEHNVEDTDASTIHDLGHDHGIYPSGKSIVTGTPSRFQVRHTSPPANNLFFDGDGTKDLGRPRGSRRNTGTGALNVTTTPRPSIPRSETSPSMLSPTTDKRRGTINNDAYDMSNISQPARHSPGKRRLSDRAAVQRSPPKSGSKSTTTANSSGMRASLTQRTQKLFRRMSDSRRDFSPASAHMLPATTSGGGEASPGPHQNSPKRPRTAHPTETCAFSSMQQTQRDGAFSPGASTTTSSSSSSKQTNNDNNKRRPLSQDSSDLALVAANQALLSRRQSHQPLQAPQQSTNRGLFFKRAGSGRR